MVAFLGFVILALLTSVQSKSIILERCLLEAQQANSLGSLCDNVFTQNETLNLLDCGENKDRTSDIILCQKYINEYDIKKVSIQIFNLNSHKALNGSDLIHQITVKDANEPSSGDGSDLVFADGGSIKVERLSVRSSPIKLSTLKNLVHNFKLLELLHISELKDSDGDIDDQFFPREKLSNLARIGLYDSRFKNINENAFTLDDSLRHIDLVNLEFSGDGIATHAFNIDQTRCYSENSSLTLKVDSCKLTLSSLRPYILVVGNNNHFCPPPRLTFNLTNNLLERILPESAFGKLFGEAWRPKKKLDLRFHSDSIDCCHVDNRWLFKLISNHSDSRSQLAIKCVDLDKSVYAYKNMTFLEETCDSRNVFPVLTITIISILLLTVFLAVFSFICVYYVLPRRGSIIMLNSANRGATVSYAKTGEITHLKSSHLPKVESKNDRSSIISNPLKPIKTTRVTKDTASIATKLTEITLAQKSAKTGKERSIDCSTLRSSNSDYPQPAKKQSRESGHGAKKAFYGTKLSLNLPKTSHKSTPTANKSLASAASPRSPISPRSPKSPRSPLSPKLSKMVKTVNSIKSAHKKT